MTTFWWTVLIIVGVTAVGFALAWWHAGRAAALGQGRARRLRNSEAPGQVAHYRSQGHDLANGYHNNQM